MWQFMKKSGGNFTLILLMLLMQQVGCGSGSETIAVSGVVTHNSKPLADADVSFIPAQGRPAYGRSDSNGRFTLTTFNNNDGAVPGEHVVTISKSVEVKPATDTNPYAEYKSVVPGKYGRPQDSPLTATVGNGGEMDFSFDVNQ